MKAKEVPDGTWFMVKRTKQWYKKLLYSSMTVTASRLETKKQFYIDGDEDVLLEPSKQNIRK